MECKRKSVKDVVDNPTFTLVSQIYEKTKEYFCYGLEFNDIAIRAAFALKMQPGEIAVDFGLGQGRSTLAVAMANPYIYAFVFDIGRHDIEDVDLAIQSATRMMAQNTPNVIFQFGDSRTIFPKWDKPVKLLSVDSHGGYDHTMQEITRWFPFVVGGGRIFIQSYNIYDNVHKDIQPAIDAYIKDKPRYKLEGLYQNTLAIDVVAS